MVRLHFPEIKRTQFTLHSFAEIYHNSTVGERAADKIANLVGSWKFIIFQSVLLVIWIIVNSAAIVLAWDPYPFILMNLVLSTQAAFAAPIIMMSQNRQAAKDRMEAHNDFLIDQKSEQGIALILEQLTAQNEALKLIYERLDAIENKQK
jgi:uncharacterized membrane protein